MHQSPPEIESPIIPTGFSQPVAETLPGVIDQIVRALKPEKIVLFGSYARGEQTADSDVDLLVVMETNEDHLRRSSAVSESISPQPFPTDITVRTPDEVQRAFDRNEYFVPHILSEGRMLYDTGTTWWVQSEERQPMTLPPDIAEWLQIAEEDIALARSALRRKNAIPSGACFHAQQCIEKYLKALLIKHGSAVIKTHDLEVLFAACVAAGATVTLDTAELRELTKHAVQSRYPSSTLTMQAARDAVQTAGKMRRTLRKALGL